MIYYLDEIKDCLSPSAPVSSQAPCRLSSSETNQTLNHFPNYELSEKNALV